MAIFGKVRLLPFKKLALSSVTTKMLVERCGNLKKRRVFGPNGLGERKGENYLNSHRFPTDTRFEQPTNFTLYNRILNKNRWSRSRYAHIASFLLCVLCPSLDIQRTLIGETHFKDAFTTVIGIFTTL